MEGANTTSTRSPGNSRTKFLTFSPARMRQRQVSVLQLHAKNSVRHLFDDSRLYGLVRTHGPFSVTATQCSKCAEQDPSFVTAVHLSLRTFDSGRPALTIGSIASTMPSFSRGFSFFRST